MVLEVSLDVFFEAEEDILTIKSWLGQKSVYLGMAFA